MDYNHKIKYKIAILQPAYPHYREAFFLEIKKKFNIDLFQVSRKEQDGLNQISTLNIKKLKTIFFSKAVFFYFPVKYFFKYKIIIISGEFKYITNWFILLFGKLTGTKIIIWWHGVNNRKRISDNFSIPFFTRLFAKLSSGMLLYTEKEKLVWCKYMMSDKIHFLNNSLDTRPIVEHYLKNKINKEDYKKKHNIKQRNILIYCARFSNPNRRTDKMLELIEILDKNKYGFIIIGEGKYKPDFSKYTNVYDFNAVYDTSLKNELFIIADLYFQLGAIGLSVVEAMAYGLPVLTLKRSKVTKQGTEYGYLIHNYNSYLGSDVSDIKNFVETFFHDMQLNQHMKTNAIQYVKNNLSIEHMIKNFENAIFKIWQAYENSNCP